MTTQTHVYSCFMFSSSWKSFLSWNNSVIFHWGNWSNANILVCIPTWSLSRAYVPSVDAEDKRSCLTGTLYACSVSVPVGYDLELWFKQSFSQGTWRETSLRSTWFHLLHGLVGRLLNLRPRHQLTSMDRHFISGCEPAVDQVKSIGKSMPWSCRACFCFVSTAKNNYYKTLYIKYHNKLPL